MIERIEEALKVLLADSSEEVREAASASADRVRAKRSAGEFLHRLRTGAIAERMRIVFAAGEIGGTEGISILTAALSDPEEEVRAAAARALAAFPAVPVLKALVDQLPREKGVVLGNLLEALGSSRRRELAPVVERYLPHPDPEIAGKALVAYARTAGAPGLDKVLARAGDASPTVRAAVAEALGEWSAG